VNRSPFLAPQNVLVIALVAGSVAGGIALVLALAFLSRSDVPNFLEQGPPGAHPRVQPGLLPDMDDEGPDPDEWRRLGAPVPFSGADGKVKGWKVTFPGRRPLATAAVADGKVFLGGGFGSSTVYALDAATGRRLWHHATADAAPPPAA